MSDKVTEESNKLAAESGLTVQPPPQANDQPSSHDLVVEDLLKRKEFGLAKYGTLLQVFNGRNSLEDAYDEILDLAVYLRTLLEEERRSKSPELDSEILKKAIQLANRYNWFETERLLSHLLREVIYKENSNADGDKEI